MSNITLNIVEPGSAPVVPDTGLFTAGIGGPEATIITAVSTVLLLTIVAVVVAMLYKKHKKQGKVTKLVSTVDACATVVKSKKRVSTGLAAVALLVSAGTFAGLLVNAGKSNTNAAEGEDGLTLDVSSEDLTIEVGSEPVFAVLPVEVSVEQATEAGYTLTAYADSTDLVSTTDESKTIPMVAVEGDELVALTGNTYGLALDEEPTTKDAEVYMPLSIDSDTPTILKATDYVETEANDTTTIYYGFYITPDVPYGTYTGTNINYNVEPHYITNLSFNGNGNDGGVDMEGMTLLAGDTITLPENTYTKEGYSFTGWNTVAEGTGKPYADKAEFTASLDKSEDVTLYAQWEEPCPANSICYKANGANTGENDPKMSNQSASSSTDTTLWASNFKYDTNGDGGNDYGFAGWSTDKNAASKINNTGDDKPTIYGPNQTIATGDLSKEGMKLYAVWIAPANENSTLQGFTCPSDTAMPIGNVMALKDNRDSQVYTVAKLADGNCWMVENLRLADTHKEGGQTVTTTISSSNTHNPASGFTALAASSDDWCVDLTDACINQNKLNTDNTASTIADMNNANSNVYSYGNYYNWYSATAGNGIYETGSGEIVGGDICPNGWHLPYGGNGTGEKGGNTSGGFYYLNGLIGGTTNSWRSFPNNFVYSGFHGKGVDDRGSGGNYWSSTAKDAVKAYYLGVGNFSVGPGYSYSKYYGYLVRCVTLGQ